MCEQQRIYSKDGTQDYQIVYVCKNVWDVGYNSQQIAKNTDQNSVTALWISGNKLFNVYSYNSYSQACNSYEECVALEERQHRQQQTQTVEFLSKLVNNEETYVGGFYLDWTTQQFVNYLLTDCKSDIKEKAYQGSWQCKQEPVICPAHGEQKETCTRWNSELNKYDTREATISCNPGICSGCTLPKWFDYPSDSKCMEYGFRFEHQTGWDLKDVFVDYSNDESLTVAEASNQNGLSLTVYPNNSARLIFEEGSDKIDLTMEQGQTYAWGVQNSELSYTVTANKIVYISGEEQCWPEEQCWDECWEEEICEDFCEVQCADYDEYGECINWIDVCTPNCYSNTICQTYCEPLNTICYAAGNYEDSYIELTFRTTGIYQTRNAATFNAFCDIDGQIKQQKSAQLGGEWAKCQNNFECSSNLCSDGECIELKAIANELQGFKGFIIKMLCRLSNPFSEDGYAQCLSNNI